MLAVVRGGVRERSAGRERMRLRRRRMFVLALALTAVVIQLVQGGRDERHAASARPVAPAVARVSPSAAPTKAPAAVRPSPAPASPSVSPSPSPTPKGPPFVLDAAPSCAGNTALIDIQVAATAARPIAKLELLLDGAAAPLTPSPAPPLTSFAGRSSGRAAPGGSGHWMIRASDSEGFADTRFYPYACG